MKLAASSTCATQCMNVSSGQATVAGQGSAPGCQCSTCNRVWPALSCCRTCHWPVACKVWRIASSQSGSVRGYCKALRHTLTCKAFAAAGCGQFCQCAVPASCWGHWARSCLRKWISIACTSAAVKTWGALGVSASAVLAAACTGFVSSLSQASTASLLAWGRQARNSSIRLLAARVVESFQPVSSRTASCWPANKALMRRVRARSLSTRATSPCSCCTARCTQAAAHWASSSGSCVTCRRAAGSCAGGVASGATSATCAGSA